MYQNNASPWVWFRAWQDDGTPKTDLVYNTASIAISAVRDSGLTALTLSDAASATDWAAGKFWQVEGNLYKVGISTATISGYTGLLSVEGSFDGGRINGLAVEVSAYNPSNDPATAGAQMDIVDAPNGTAVGVFQSGLSTHAPADVVTALGTGATLTACATATGFATPGAAMTLTSGERSTLAGVLDLAIINQGDGADLIGALADAIAADWVASDASPLAVIAAMKADATLAQMISRIDVTSSSRMAATDYTAPLDAAATQAAAAAAITAAELATGTDVATAQAAIESSCATATGFSTHGPADVWTAETRTLTSFGSLVSDILTAIGLTTLWTNLAAMITGSGGTAAWSATAMANAPTGGGGSGTGPNEFTLTITDTNGAPLEGVNSRLVADVANDFRATTVANGQALFGLPSLTYTVILTKAGYTFTPVTLAVAASGGQTYQMIPVTITAPTTPGTATGVLIVRDKAQAPLQGVPVHVQLIRGAGASNAGNSPGAQVWTQTSDASGQVQFVGLLHGGTYRGWRDQDRTNAVEFTVPATASYQLPETIGE